MPPQEPSFPKGNTTLEPLNERQIYLFLREKGLRHLDMQDWKPGDPILFLLPDAVRSDGGLYDRSEQKLSKERRPSVVRVAHPTSIGPESASGIWPLRIKKDSRVDYYAIHPVTKEIERVKESTDKTGEIGKLYSVHPSMLFVPDDTLFPPSSP